ncbi:MAG: EamA family transporter [Aestuariivirga sp.]
MPDHQLRHGVRAVKPRGMTAIETPVKTGLTPAEKGVLYAIFAHLTWGAMAVYFGFLRHVSPMEIAVHRGLWSIPCAGLIIWWLGQYKDVLQAIASKRNLAILTLTSAIIVLNWGFYIWSIEVGRTLESSLGYYINPLMNVVMGYLFLGERFNRLQMVALVLAVIAVLIQTFAAGVFPWLGLMLASTFASTASCARPLPWGRRRASSLKSASSPFRCCSCSSGSWNMARRILARPQRIPCCSWAAA